MARLGDIATYINGYAFKPADWSDIGLPIIRIQDLTGNSYQANRYSGNYEKKYEVNAGDVLISWSASLGVYVWSGEKSILNQHIFKVVFDKLLVDKNFFVYQVQNILEKASSQAHGATMKHLTKPVFDALPFYLPPIEEQRKIAKVLNELTHVISLRKQQLAKLDELVKARFVEMFGDPVHNERGWRKIPLKCICDVGSSKRVFEKEYVKEGVPFYRTKEIVELSRGCEVSTELFICKDRFEEIKEVYGVPQKGDLLISAVGTIGTIWIVDGTYDFYFKDGNILQISASSNFNSVYMKYLLQDLINNYKTKMATGTAYAALTIAGLKDMQVYDVPLNMQNDFSDFCIKTELQKLTIHQSLAKLEILKKSLMQKYFE